MTRNEAADYLHNLGYSRRLSAKLVDVAILSKSNKTFGLAFKAALEKARTKGAKDKKKRLLHGELSPREYKKLHGVEKPSQRQIGARIRWSSKNTGGVNPI
jgi:hypothetical protein